MQLVKPYGPDPADAARVVGRVTAILSIAAGVLHVSAAGDHTDLPVMLVAFLVAAALQLALGAVLLSRRPSPALIAAAVALMLGSVGIWVVSRTAGLPAFTGEAVEPVGFKDSVTKLFELAAVPGLLLLSSADLRRVVLPMRLVTRAATTAATASFALLAPALVVGGGHHHLHGGHSLAHAHGGKLAHAHTGSSHRGSAGHHAGHRTAGAHAGHHAAGAAHAAGAHGQSHAAHTELAAFHVGGHHLAGAHSHSPGHAHSRGHAKHGHGHHGPGGHHRGGHHRRGHHHGRHRSHDGHHGHSAPPQNGGPGQPALSRILPPAVDCPISSDICLR